MAFARKDNLGVFSPISDTSSTDLPNRTPHGDDAKFFPGGFLSSALSKRPQPFVAPKTEKSLPPTIRRSIVHEEMSNKRRSMADTKNGVFSPLRESDDDSTMASPQFTSSRPPSARPAITSTPIMPFSLSRGDLLASYPKSAGSDFAASVTTRPPASRTSASTLTPGMASSVENGHRRRSENGAGTSTMVFPKYVGISKATQTTPDLATQPPTTNVISAAAQNIQADFVRNVVEDCLDEFKLVWRADCYSFYAKMLQMFSESEQRVEDTIGAERLDYMRRLVDENERLRVENERLKAMQFGKFF